MANDPAALIRRFEPILYFHQKERFFPSDAKRYLEHCALWQAQSPFDSQTSWGGIGSPFPRQPLIPKGKIAAASNEIRPGDTYLGDSPFLQAANEERFLEPSSWVSAVGFPSDEVTPTSSNEHSHLEMLAQFYNHRTAANPELKQSRFWYHAETFDQVQLRTLAAEQTRNSLLTPFLLSREFTEPFVICYYLFFPGHFEGLQGCENTQFGPDFGTFAGEWTCVTVLLDRPNPTLGYEPKHIGLASRNTENAQKMDDDERVGMVVHDWGDAKTFSESPDHPRIFVARDTHSLYLDPGQKELKPLLPFDFSTEFCGATEGLAKLVSSEPPLAGSNFSEAFPLTFVKLFGGAAVTGLVGLGFAGAVAGLIWGLNEFEDPVQPPAAIRPTVQQDFPPEADEFGIILHPPNFVPPDADRGTPRSWPPASTIPLNNRTYSTIVDRTNPDESKRQIWLPSGTNALQGFEGRWGPRVSRDPFGRRAGMRFPEFTSMFLEALLKELSKS